MLTIGGNGRVGDIVPAGNWTTSAPLPATHPETLLSPLADSMAAARSHCAGVPTVIVAACVAGAPVRAKATARLSAVRRP